MLLGEDKAQQLGLNPRRVEFLLVLGATMASAAAVAVSGLIGFVGLIVPHVVRLLIGPDHRLLLPGAIALGASFVVLADVAARSLLAPVEIPVGVVTALMGGPFFLYLLSRTKES
jgi:iron complex transport system permease protein